MMKSPGIEASAKGLKLNTNSFAGQESSKKWKIQVFICSDGIIRYFESPAEHLQIQHRHSTAQPLLDFAESTQ